MEKSSLNRKDKDANLSERRIYATGLIIVFGVEFILRDFLLPENAGNIQIVSVIVVEWLTLSFLIFFLDS